MNFRLKNMKNIVNKYNLGFVVDDSDINDQLNAVKKINSGALQNNKKNVKVLIDVDPISIL